MPRRLRRELPSINFSEGKRALKVGTGKRGRDGNGTGTGNRVIFGSRPRFADPYRRQCLFPTSTIPLYVVVFPFPTTGIPVPITSAYPVPTIPVPIVYPVPTIAIPLSAQSFTSHHPDVGARFLPSRISEYEYWSRWSDSTSAGFLVSYHMTMDATGVMQHFGCNSGRYIKKKARVLLYETGDCRYSAYEMFIF